MRFWIAVAGLSGASALAMGAYGAHGLALAPTQKAWFETAVMWHALHAPAIAAAAALLGGSAGARARLLHVAAALFAAGTILFSGALYALALFGVAGFVVPVGGTTLILGWLVLAASALVQGRTST